ncbi:MAG: peptide chain release factor N(5)-glutamine methyltransferase [bacterium]
MEEKEVTVQEALHRVSHCLAQKGFENPRLNGELLLSWALCCRRIDLYLKGDRLLSRQEAATLQEALERRLSHTPIQYIVGSTQFLSCDLIVNEDVFIPRPETEILVEAVVKRLQVGWSGDTGPVVVDLGTGCGNIAISLAQAFPRARVYATDISERALSVARENGRLNDLAAHISFHLGNLFEPLGDFGLREGADAIVSNPPYIVTSEIADLPPEVRDFEPQVALDGGEDGLDVLLRVVREAPVFLRRDGLLALEVGQGQADVVRCMMAGEGRYEGIEVIRDLNGIQRVVMGTKMDGGTFRHSPLSGGSAL